MSFRRGRGMGNGRFDGGRGRDGDSGRGGRGGGRESRDARDAGPRGLSNHTSDAAMASARIFIGNLPTNDARLTKELLEETFNSYGHILGISILKGFGFIQYAEEISVEKAIRGAQNTEILGHRMDVKNARSGKDGINMGGGNPEGNFRDRSPIRRREFDMGNRSREPDMPMRGREPEMMMRGREPEREHHPRDFDGRDREWGNRDRNMDHYPVEPFMEHERERHPRDPFHQMPSDNLGGNFGGNLMPKQGPPSANEVEIIVTSKIGPLRQFAECIEARVKSLGFAVDVLFPHEEIPIRKVLTDLSNRGTFFGIILTPLNQEHSSITLNILFGQPEDLWLI